MKTKLVIYETADGKPLMCSFADEHSVPFEETDGGSDEYPEYYCEYKKLGVYYNSEEKYYWCEDLSCIKKGVVPDSYRPDKSLTIIRLE